MNKLLIRVLLAAWVLLVFLEVSKASVPYVPMDAPPVPAAAPAVSTAQSLAASIHGSIAAVAATGSMLPTITAADIIIYRPATLGELAKGDMIVFDAVMRECNSSSTEAYRVCPSSMYAHRVIDITTECSRVGQKLMYDGHNHHIRTPGYIKIISQYATTKGDANLTADPFRTTQDKLRGVIIYIVNGQTGEIRYTRGAV